MVLDSLKLNVARLLNGSFSIFNTEYENLDTQTLLGYANQELESVTRQVRDELTRVVSERYINEEAIEQKTVILEDLEDKAKAALESNDEESARQIVNQQMDIEDQMPILDEAMDIFDENIEDLEYLMNALTAKKHELARGTITELSQNAQALKSMINSSFEKDSAEEQELNSEIENFDLENRSAAIESRINQYLGKEVAEPELEEIEEE